MPPRPQRNESQKAGKPTRVRGAGNRMIATSGGTLSGKPPSALHKQLKKLVKKGKQAGEVRSEGEVAALIHEVVCAHSVYANADYHSGMTKHLEDNVLEKLKERINGEKDTGRFGDDSEAEDPEAAKIPAGRVRLSHRSWFSAITCSAIMVNAIQMGIEVDHPELKFLTNRIEHTILVIFVIEMVVRVYELRLQYFCAAWNLMEFGLVVLGCLDVWLLTPMAKDSEEEQKGGVSLKQLSLLRVLRLLRFFRGLRLLSIFESLFLIIDGMVKSVTMIGWVSLLLLVLVYICAILCTQFIGGQQDQYPESSEDIEVDLNAYQYFGTLPRSMYTLFNIVILAEWPELGRSILERQPELFVFFLSFVMFTTFGLMNVIIGVIVENTQTGAESIMDDAGAEAAVETLENLGRLHTLLFSIDKDESHIIDKAAFVKIWQQDPEAQQEFFQLLDLPRLCSAEECFDLLDQNGEGKIRAADVMLHAFRLVDHSAFQQNMVKHFLLNRVFRSVRTFIKRLEKLTEATDPAENGNGDATTKDINAEDQQSYSITAIERDFNHMTSPKRGYQRDQSKANRSSPGTAAQTKGLMRASAIADAVEKELTPCLDVIQHGMNKRGLQLDLLEDAIAEQKDLPVFSGRPVDVVRQRVQQRPEQLLSSRTSRSQDASAPQRFEMQLDKLAESNERVEEHLVETSERLCWIEGHIHDMKLARI